MTREELEVDYKRMLKQTQQDYEDLFGSEAPSLRKLKMQYNIKKIKDIATKIFFTILFFSIILGIPAIFIAAIVYHNILPGLVVISLLTLIAVGNVIWAGIANIWDL